MIILDMENLGPSLANLRRLHGLTQYQLADLMHTTQGVISELERGISVPLLTTVIRYCKALGYRFGLDPLPEEEDHHEPRPS